MTAEVRGDFVQLDGEQYYRIANYDHMRPFLMTVANDSDLWTYLCSSGGLTAGRVSAESSLFPYETVDRLEDAHHHTGPVTVVRVTRADGSHSVWRPFKRATATPDVQRNLYKNEAGNRVVFEEIHTQLGLTFRYRWSGCDQLGLIRTAWLVNDSDQSVSVSLLDGLRNVLPYGAELALYQQTSSLVDAYKRTDCEPDLPLAIFSLTSQIIDRPEAGEELRANCVWSAGLDNARIHLRSETVADFEQGRPLPHANVLTGRRGNFMVEASFKLASGEKSTWHLVGNVGQSHAQLAKLGEQLRENVDLVLKIERQLDDATRNLTRNVASADGIQVTANPTTDAHHFANVLFNNMRGGVFHADYSIPTQDFVEFLRVRNRHVSEQYADDLVALPSATSRTALMARAETSHDPDFRRLVLEYLPLTFGRRHGDPSRPWNKFYIRPRSADGQAAIGYEGNWRDIFQNWEALALSYPGYLQSFVAKFVNASTVDGFNPYRVNQDGFEWEVFEADRPWSHIGYWGDHQIVYLLRLLECLHRHEPAALKSMLTRPEFSYADVPYRLGSYESMLKDPHHTIVFDESAAARVDGRVRNMGTDGKLVANPRGQIVHVTLLEKLLVPALSKLSNFVPDAGIWMNTQRPEWNDANNALAGYGISMVTLCYLERYMEFLASLVDGDESFLISTEVFTWMKELGSVFDAIDLSAGNSTPPQRQAIMYDLGRSFETYRTAVYNRGFSGEAKLTGNQVLHFAQRTRLVLEHTLNRGRRPDGLFHSYNLLDPLPHGMGFRHLYEMLEGQVAALSAGSVTPREAIELLKALFASRMYREDQRSFLLYPARELPPFMERNIVPEELVAPIPLLVRCLQEQNHSIVERDAANHVRFNADFNNAGDLDAALDELAADARWQEQVGRDRTAVLDAFEAVFLHHEFTGRSGRIYGYEGLGSIYWHMVAKLLLGVQELLMLTLDTEGSSDVTAELTGYYYRIRDGLGYLKTPQEYGAFPTDPYSHTPADSGAKQPGMTGQVKEEILIRFGELGLRVGSGRVRFDPRLLARREFLDKSTTCTLNTLEGTTRSVEIPTNGLAFTYCQVPVVYQISADGPWIRVLTSDGERTEYAGIELDEGTGKSLFARDGRVVRIDVGVSEAHLAD